MAGVQGSGSGGSGFWGLGVLRVSDFGVEALVKMEPRVGAQEFRRFSFRHLGPRHALKEDFGEIRMKCPGSPKPQPKP